MVCDARQTEVGRRWGGLGFYLEHYKKRLMEVQGVRSWATWLAHEIAQVFSRDKDSLHNGLDEIGENRMANGCE